MFRVVALSALCAWLAVALPSPVAAGFDEGAAAYERGDHTTALREFRPLANQGNGLAQFNLGLMHSNGQGVPWNDTLAVKWYRKAAEQGLAVAQHHLGVMYGQGRGVAQNHVEAVKWYRKAAEQGFALAHAILGYMYQEGQGVPQNYAEAYFWYSLAAMNGDDLAVIIRNRTAKKLTASQVSAIQQRTLSWKPCGKDRPCP